MQILPLSKDLTSSIVKVIDHILECHPENREVTLVRSYSSFNVGITCSCGKAWNLGKLVESSADQTISLFQDERLFDRLVESRRIQFQKEKEIMVVKDNPISHLEV